MSQPVVLTKSQVLDLVRKRSRKYTSPSAYADAIGVTRPVMSQVLSDKIPPPPKILKDIGVTRATLYVQGNIKTRFLDGSTEL